jgi:protein TonB
MNNKSEMFSGWSEVTSGERNRLVFENLNKSYGAYEIRVNYNRTLLKAFSSMGLFILLVSAILLCIPAIPPGDVIIPDDSSATMSKPIEHDLYVPPKSDPMPPAPKTNSNAFYKPEVSNDPIMDTASTPLVLNTPSSSGNPNDTGSSDLDSPITGGGKYIEENDSTYDGPFIQEPPTFPGGDPALLGFLQNTTIYPQSAIDAGEQGTVGVSFILDKEGNVTEVSVRNGTRYQELNTEALRVIKKLPKWNPGRQQGRAVKVRMILPIRFKLKQ